MPICLFLNFAATSVRPAVPMTLFGSIEERLSAVTGFEGLRAHVPSDADDPYLKDRDVPALALQFYFRDLGALQAQCGNGSVLERLWAGTPDGALAGVEDARGTWQAMEVERVELESPVALPEMHCTYLVAYEGMSPDEAAWHAHYFEHHVPLMKRLPGLRQLEVYRPLDMEMHAPALAAFTPVRAMQRNKVVFDSPQALTAALNSPIRHEMRKDYEQSPPFTGRATHYPMATRSWA